MYVGVELLFYSFTDLTTIFISELQWVHRSPSRPEILLSQVK